MNLHTPPENQGQIVEVSYGCRNGLVYKRVFDRSDRSESIYVSRMLADDEGDWNDPPANKRWRRITEAEYESAIED